MRDLSLGLRSFLHGNQGGWSRFRLHGVDGLCVAQKLEQSMREFFITM